jgi:hypothetical protein
LLRAWLTSRDWLWGCPMRRPEARCAHGAGGVAGAGLMASGTWSARPWSRSGHVLWHVPPFEETPVPGASLGGEDASHEPDAKPDARYVLADPGKLAADAPSRCLTADDGRHQVIPKWKLSKRDLRHMQQIGAKRQRVAGAAAEEAGSHAADWAQFVSARLASARLASARRRRCGSPAAGFRMLTENSFTSRHEG